MTPYAPFNFILFPFEHLNSIEN